MSYNLIKKHLSQPWFNLIKYGIKTHEGRINKPDSFWSNIKINDIFIFYNEDEEYTVKVIEKLIYNNFKEGINDIGLKYVLPTEYEYGNSIKKSINNVYYEQCGFKIEDELKYGIVMLKFEVL
jgi:ASC-1-like (ASCH) protein